MPPRAARPVPFRRPVVVLLNRARLALWWPVRRRMSSQWRVAGGLGAGARIKVTKVMLTSDTHVQLRTRRHNFLYSTYRPTTARFGGELHLELLTARKFQHFAVMGMVTNVRVSSTSPASALRRKGNSEFTEGRPKRSASLQTLRTYYRSSLKVTKSENLSTTNRFESGLLFRLHPFASDPTRFLANRFASHPIS